MNTGYGHLTYWLEYQDVSDPWQRRGPLGPSGVRHDNHDVARAVLSDELPWAEREERIARWETYWTKITGRPVKARQMPR